MMALTLVFLALIQGSSEEAVRLAREAVARRHQAPQARIETLKAEPVEWSDAGLGCPEPDRMYAQVVVPGFRVTLRLDGKTYVVHVGDGRAVVCERKEAEALVTRLTQLGTDDLGRRLGIPRDRITVVSTTPETWPNTALGCPEPDMMYAQVLTDGFRIRLRANDATYEYHTDDRRVVLCSK